MERVMWLVWHPDQLHCIKFDRESDADIVMFVGEPYSSERGWRCDRIVIQEPSA